MLLRFTKMHGTGNDFVVLDLISQRYRPQADHIRYMADRHFGIGCDQVLIIEPPQHAENDFRYRIFNADGGEVEQCGNGARCFARYVSDKGLTGKTSIKVETACGIIELHLEDQVVRVNMGVPEFEPANIPFKANKLQPLYSLDVDGQHYDIGALSMGNPHAVLCVDDIDTAPVATLGPAIEQHSLFPNRVNVGFMQINARDDIHLRVFERGTGETLACGTGACAAVVHGIQQGWLDHSVTAHLRGGDVSIHWQGKNHPVQLVGPACHVYDGKIKLKK